MPGRRPFNYDHEHRRRGGKTLVESAHKVKLLCGHETTGFPVAIYPSRRELYVCPEGCGLQKSKAKSS